MIRPRSTFRLVPQGGTLTADCGLPFPRSQRRLHRGLTPTPCCSSSSSLKGKARARHELALTACSHSSPSILELSLISSWLLNLTCHCLLSLQICHCSHLDHTAPRCHNNWQPHLKPVRYIVSTSPMCPVGSGPSRPLWLCHHCRERPAVTDGVLGFGNREYLGGPCARSTFPV